MIAFESKTVLGSIGAAVTLSEFFARVTMLINPLELD